MESDLNTYDDLTEDELRILLYYHLMVINNYNDYKMHKNKIEYIKKLLDK